MASLISFLHILSPSRTQGITTHAAGQVLIEGLHHKSLLFCAVEPQPVLQMGETNIIDSKITGANRNICYQVIFLYFLHNLLAQNSREGKLLLDRQRTMQFRSTEVGGQGPKKLLS